MFLIRKNSNYNIIKSLIEKNDRVSSNNIRQTRKSILTIKKNIKCDVREIKYSCFPLKLLHNFTVLKDKVKNYKCGKHY